MIPPNPYGRDHEWETQRQRRRLMTGKWLVDLRARMVREVGQERTDAWGVPKQTSNIFCTVKRELSAIYLASFLTRCPDGSRLDGAKSGAAVAFARALTLSGFAARQIEFQPLVLGCEEYLWRVHVYADGRIGLRPVPADVCEIEPDPEDPSMPYRVSELRWRPQVKAWCWDVLCAAEEEYRVELYTADGSPGEDVTIKVLGGAYSGAAYPYRAPDGTPIQPYELYHATALGDQLWHCDRGIETVEGCLDLAVLYTFLGHVMKAASWPQRWSLNAILAGSETGAADAGTVSVEGAAPYMTAAPGRSRVITDPAMLLQFIQPPDASGQPQIGQFITSADPVAMEAVISAMANRIAVEAGMPAQDIQRMGGTARSGFAIGLTNATKRETARRYAPAFHAPDVRMINRMAALWSRATQQTLPDGLWDVEYQDLPLSSDELRERRANVIESINAGLLSRNAGYSELNPGITPQQAAQDLAAIDFERARASSAAGARSTTIALTSTDVAGIVTVNEARLSQGLPVLPTADGHLTVSEFQAKHAATIAAAANATAGTTPGI